MSRAAPAGWVLPPPWTQVVRALAPWAELAHAPRLVLLGTGGWAFGARALAGVAPPSRLAVCDQLDPDALATAVAGRPRPLVVAVSESGSTAETVALATAVQTRFGLPVRWLTGSAVSVSPDMPTTALLAAPLSVPFLVWAARAAAGAGGGTAGLAIVYQALQRRARAIGEWAAQAAAQLPTGAPRVRVELPAGSEPGLRLYALQALRQGLGGKGGPQRPWWDVVVVGDPDPPPAELVLRLPAGADQPRRLGRVLARCYAVCALVASIGTRSGVEFTTHPAVTRYKRLLGTPGATPVPVAPGRIVARATEWLRERDLTAGHLVCYEPRLLRHLAAGRAKLVADSGRSWEVHAGSRWNHHSYQAVQAEPGIGLVAVAPADLDDPLVHGQADLAAATCASLGERALLLRPEPEVAS